MVRPDRFELPTYWFVASCSIQLSYGRTDEATPNIAIHREPGKKTASLNANGAHTIWRAPHSIEIGP